MFRTTGSAGLQNEYSVRAVRAIRQTRSDNASESEPLRAKRPERITQVTVIPTTRDLAGSGLVARSAGTGGRHLSGGGACVRPGVLHGGTVPSSG